MPCRSIRLTWSVTTFAALNPNRVRSLTLTNCDTRDNWPPEAFKPFVDMAVAGGLKDTLNAMLRDKAIYRSPSALGPAYERPEDVSDEDIEIYLRPLVRSEQRTRDLQRFVAAFDHKHTVVIEPRLRKLLAPTLIVWGTDDIYFPVKWAYWLAQTIPGEAAGRVGGRADLLPGGAGEGVQPTAARSPVGGIRTAPRDGEPHGTGRRRSKYRPRVDWVMRQKILRTAPAGPTAKRSQATTVIGKAYRFAIANWLAERLNMTCRRMSASGRYVRLATAWSKAPISR
jgi:hypothetical protein